MAVYSENIHLHQLHDNHTLVELEFSLRDEVHVQCEQANHDQLCVTEVSVLPLHVLGLVAQSKARRISFHTPSGPWNEFMWGAQPWQLRKEGDLANSLGTRSTTLAADTHIDNWPTLRAYLATLLGVPLNPSGVDINQHPVRLSINPTTVMDGNEIEPDHDSAYAQFFPLMSANADRWPLWSRHLLLGRGQRGIATIVDSHTLHDSLWYSLSLHIRTTSLSNTTSIDNNVQLLDESQTGVYQVHVSVRVSMVVPSAIPDSSHSTANTHVLHKIQRFMYNEQNRKSDATTTPSTITYASLNNTTTKIPVHSTNTATIEAFWHDVRSSTTTIHSDAPHNTIAGTISGGQPILVDKCSQELKINRQLFDSRAMHFTVLTTIQPRNIHANYTHHFVETLSDTFFINLAQYRYQLIRSQELNSTSAGGFWSDPSARDVGFTGLVRDLEGFVEVNGDCDDVVRGRVSSPYPTTQRCAGSYHYPLPPIPAHHTLLLTYTANKRLLSREHQPIDASRGALIPPAVLYSCNRDSPVIDRYCSLQTTPSFIVLSPIPDGSMPYNVITLVSTLLAFFLGSFINAILKNNKTNKNNTINTSCKNGETASKSANTQHTGNASIDESSDLDAAVGLSITQTEE